MGSLCETIRSRNAVLRDAAVQARQSLQDVEDFLKRENVTVTIAVAVGKSWMVVYGGDGRDTAEWSVGVIVNNPLPSSVAGQVGCRFYAIPDMPDYMAVLVGLYARRLLATIDDELIAVIQSVGFEEFCRDHQEER